MLAPMLFNSNDQPVDEETRRFLYAVDLAVTAQSETFEEVQEKLQKALTNLIYADDTSLIAANMNEMGILLNRLEEISRKYKLNVNNTKIIIIDRGNITCCSRKEHSMVM